MPPTHAFAFLGTDRFEIRRKLGSGGMGVVYEAYDRQEDETVALKVLHLLDPGGIYRFKKEFRGLADVVHRNLASLFELIAHDDVWFFTMELVDGGDFLEYVRPGWEPLSDEPSTDVDASWPGRMGSDDAAEDPVRRALGTMDEDRLRAAVRQLAEGVAALHKAGRGHRDLKPSNVKVAEDGRVVVLDFGIAAELRPRTNLRTEEDGLWGTVPYMAPEQGTGRFLPASDWYAVGTLLYEGLTGDRPYTGTPAAILTAKQLRDPERPTGPADLVELCMELLARDPEDRPSVTDVLARLGGTGRVSVVTSRRSMSGVGPVLVGRDGHLESLGDAFAVARGGRPVMVHVLGPSGIGKSAIVREFTDRLERADEALVLASRCYALESVPYKGLDGVIDVLSRFLKYLPRSAADRFVPHDVGALTTVFPVLNRVPVVQAHSARAESVYDHRELRQRAVIALRAMLANIGRQRPVVIHIDDLQWSDADSAELISALLSTDEPVRLLLVASFRSEEFDSAPFLRDLVERAERLGGRIVRVGPLTESESALIAQRGLSSHSAASLEYAQSLVAEAEGNPFLIEQMVRFVIEAEAHDKRTGVSLADMMSARLRQAPAGARELCEVLAVAARPLSPEIAHQAAVLPGSERPLVKRLRATNFVRTTAGGGRIELYQNRMADMLLEQLSDEAVRTIHQRLAECLEAKGIDDPEALYQHYLAIGDDARAAHYAARAAEHADRALAFDRAAQLYRQAIDLHPDHGARTGEWNVGLGNALASAGSGASAANAYLRASAVSEGRERLELERRAGEQLLMTGQIDRGLAVMRRVLERVGLTLPPTPRRALLALLWRRIRLRWRGLAFRERHWSDADPDQLVRIDVCWTVAAGLSLVDNVQGASFQALHILLALDTGEPTRVARALAMEAGTLSTQGSRATRRSRALFDRAWGLANRLDSRYAKGLCAVMSAVDAYHTGRWRDAGRFAEEAEDILTHQLSLVAWELNSARLYRVYHLFFLGDLNRMSALADRFLQDAVERHNVFGSITFRAGWSTIMWLRANDVVGARDALAAAEAALPPTGFHVTHFICMLSHGLIELYDDRPEAGLAHLHRIWTPFHRSLLGRIQNLRINAWLTRAKCQIGFAAGQPADRKQEQRLRDAESDLRRVEREEVEWATAIASALRGTVAVVRKQPRSAVDHYTDAIRRFGERDMHLFRDVTCLACGTMLNDERGLAMAETARESLLGQGVMDVEKLRRALIAL